MTYYSNDFTAAVDINWLRDPVGLREFIDQCRPVPEPVLVGPPEKVAEVERLLAEKGVHGVRTVVDKRLNSVHTVPVSLIDPPHLPMVYLTDFEEHDGPFKSTAMAYLFKQWNRTRNRDHARLMAPSQDSFDRIYRGAQVFEACARIHNVYDDTHRNPWRKCRSELATILEHPRHPRRIQP